MLPWLLQAWHWMTHFLSIDKIRSIVPFTIFSYKTVPFYTRVQWWAMTSTIQSKMFSVNNEGLNCLSSQYGSIFLPCELKDAFGICFNHHFNTYVVQPEKISSLNNVFKKHLKINAAISNTYTESMSGNFPFFRWRKACILDRGIKCNSGKTAHLTLKRATWFRSKVASKH